MKAVSNTILLSLGLCVASLGTAADLDATIENCNGCHGDGVSQNWPDGGAYEDRAGAHDKHVQAIGTGNASCDTCHPGNPPASHPDGSTPPARLINHDADGNGTVDADAGNYLDIGGGSDHDGRYNQVTQTCLNINCHSGVETPPWYGGGGGPASKERWIASPAFMMTYRSSVVSTSGPTSPYRV